MIKRRLQNELLPLLEAFPVVAIIGSRQVGKTTLAKIIARELKKETLYLDLESPRDANKLRDPEHFLALQTHKTVILDEIQRMPKLFEILRGIIDRNRTPGRFIILGSASPKLLQQSSESLAGRIAYLELHPIHFSELPNPDFRQHWLFGGYPEVVTAKNPLLKRVWIDNFIKTYIERDLAILGLNISALRLQNLLLLLASINGMQLNKSMLAKSLQVSSPTIARYLEFLEGAFLLRTLRPYATNLRKRVSKTPKIYFQDTGILHAILGLNELEDLFGYDRIGGSWEAYILQQLIAVLPSRCQAYYFQTSSGAEIDLVIVKGLNPIACFEIKFNTAPKLKRGNREAFEILNAKHNFIVAPIEESYPITANIEVIGIAEAVKMVEQL